MEGKEPKIIACGFTDAEIYQWMSSKAQAAKLLTSAIAERELLKKTLVELEERISELTNSATLELLNIARDPNHHY